ncbi:hypothetical protein DY000_02038390 [Brassica cretica]|uniref:Uncharacterized protein n=1 Tax=Brassica cretica TaxID=69181 RepID=A0ABQ7BBN8_BRACR|nr:hypothetical protein DY000_02038390 [Brassica cretica]
MVSQPCFWRDGPRNAKPTWSFDGTKPTYEVASHITSKASNLKALSEKAKRSRKQVSRTKDREHRRANPSKPKPGRRLTETITRTLNLLEMTRVTCLNRIQTKGIEPHRINLFTTKKESIEDSWSDRIPETRDHREKSKTPKLTEWRLDNERNGGDTQLK